MIMTSPHVLHTVSKISKKYVQKPNIKNRKFNFLTLSMEFISQLRQEF